MQHAEEHPDGPLENLVGEDVRGALRGTFL